MKENRIHQLSHMAEAINKSLGNQNSYWFRSSEPTLIRALAEVLIVNRSLTSLSISVDYHVMEELAEALKVNQCLTSLNLSGNKLDDAGAKTLAEVLKANGNLTSLRLDRCSLSIAGIMALAEVLKVNGSLTLLALNKENLGAKGSNALAEALKINQGLTYLNLSNCKLGAAGVKALADALKINQNLISLVLCWEGLGAAQVEALAEVLKVNQHLTLLSLRGTKLDAAAAEMLAEAVKVNRSLTSLDLNKNNLGAAGGNALAEALKVNQSLASLYLCECNLGDAGVIALAEVLKVNQNLTSLELRWNQFGDAGAYVLAEALKINQSLTSLDICANHLGIAAAKALMEGLKENQSLTFLGLRGTKFDAEGAKVLAEALKVNGSLISLDLRYNNLGVDGGYALAEALKVNQNLISLNLCESHVGVEGAIALVKALKVNRSLTSLNLSGNKAGGVYSALMKTLQDNITLTECIIEIECDVLARLLQRNQSLQRMYVIPLETALQRDNVPEVIRLLEQLKARYPDITHIPSSCPGQLVTLYHEYLEILTDHAYSPEVMCFLLGNLTQNNAIHKTMVSQLVAALFASNKSTFGPGSDFPTTSRYRLILALLKDNTGEPGYQAIIRTSLVSLIQDKANVRGSLQLTDTCYHSYHQLLAAVDSCFKELTEKEENNIVKSHRYNFLRMLSLQRTYHPVMVQYALLLPEIRERLKLADDVMPFIIDIDMAISFGIEEIKDHQPEVGLPKALNRPEFHRKTREEKVRLLFTNYRLDMTAQQQNFNSKIFNPTEQTREKATQALIQQLIRHCQKVVDEQAKQQVPEQLGRKQNREVTEQNIPSTASEVSTPSPYYPFGEAKIMAGEVEELRPRAPANWICNGSKSHSLKPNSTYFTASGIKQLAYICQQLRDLKVSLPQAQTCKEVIIDIVDGLAGKSKRFSLTVLRRLIALDSHIPEAFPIDSAGILYELADEFKRPTLTMTKRRIALESHIIETIPIDSLDMLRIAKILVDGFNSVQAEDITDVAIRILNVKSKEEGARVIQSCAFIIISQAKSRLAAESRKSRASMFPGECYSERSELNKKVGDAVKGDLACDEASSAAEPTLDTKFSR